MAYNKNGTFFTIELKVNKKVKKLALKSGWSVKAQEDALVLIDNMAFKNPSSKDFGTFLKNIKADDKKVLLILPAEEEAYNTYLSARNFSNILPVTVSEVLLDDILNSDKIVFTEKVAKEIEGILS